MFKQFTTNNHSIVLLLVVLVGSVASSFLTSCSSNKKEQKEEQIIISTPQTESDTADTSNLNSIKGNIPLSQISTNPHTVVLTGMPEHRLVTIYKTKAEHNNSESGYSSSNSYNSYGEQITTEYEEAGHFMPGIDHIYGYNMLNIAHYDLKLEKLNFLFDHPVLVKSLYYPCFIQDSLYKKPINRDYYLVSAYDEDTNKDTLINKKDLRRFYCFNAACTERIQLIPADYSVVRSEYDPKNDVMYIFARQDSDKNGVADIKKEPLHVFWISLKAPASAKRLY